MNHGSNDVAAYPGRAGESVYSMRATSVAATSLAVQKQRILEVPDKRALFESDPERLRALQCVEVLERIGSTGARSFEVR
jgi:hypothetical protein